MEKIILPIDGIFGSELFKLLFDIPGIKFDCNDSVSIFPDVPSKYIVGSVGENSSDWKEEIKIICYTEPTKILGLMYCHRILADGSKRYFWLGSTEPGEYLSWSEVNERAWDENFLDENLYIICDFLMGPLGRKSLDDSRYKRQKKKMIRKYEAKYVLMECLADVRPLLITLLIMLEYKNERKYMTTYLFNKYVTQKDVLIIITFDEDCMLLKIGSDSAI